LESLGAVLPLLLLAVLGYFLLIRPTRRRAQQVTSVQNALGVGAEVMLTSGIFGTVTAIDGENILVEVAQGVVLKVHRGAIGKIVTPVEHDDDLDVLDDPAALDAADSADDAADSPDDVADSPDDVDLSETDHESGRNSRGVN
jgi:preprotein translocase subunit YajC